MSGPYGSFLASDVIIARRLLAGELSDDEWSRYPPGRQNRVLRAVEALLRQGDYRGDQDGEQHIFAIPGRLQPADDPETIGSILPRVLAQIR